MNTKEILLKANTNKTAVAMQFEDCDSVEETLLLAINKKLTGIDPKLQKPALTKVSEILLWDLYNTDLSTGSTSGGLPIVEGVTGSEPIGFTAIVKNTADSFIVARLADGWYRTMLNKYNAIAIYKWHDVPMAAVTSSMYSSVSGTYKVKKTMRISSVKFPFGNVEYVMFNSSKVIPSVSTDLETVINVNELVHAENNFDFNVYFKSSSKAAYFSGTFTSDVMGSVACFFGGSQHTGSFSIPLSIYYTEDVD